MRRREIGRAIPDSERGGDDALVADQCRDDGIAFRNALASDLAVELRMGLVVEDEARAELAHARLLLSVHHVQQLMRTRDIRGDLEPRARVPAEDAPAARHLHALDRGLVGLIIVAGQHEIAVERARADPAERHQRVRPATDMDRHLLQAQQVEAVGQRAQGLDQRLANRIHRRRIQRGIGRNDRRVVVGDAEIGKFDDADATPDMADHRHHRDVPARRRIGDQCDQRQGAAERRVPGAEPVTMLKRGAVACAQARCGLPPVTHEIDRDSRRA
ncbi:hypothetical protein ACVWY3_007176 [Bradyrhizobium sp. USDA 4486]